MEHSICMPPLTFECCSVQDFFCVAWQGANWDGSASSGGGWQPCPTELRNAPKVCPDACV